MKKLIATFSIFIIILGFGLLSYAPKSEASFSFSLGLIFGGGNGGYSNNYDQYGGYGYDDGYSDYGYDDGYGDYYGYDDASYYDGGYDDCDYYNDCGGYDNYGYDNYNDYSYGGYNGYANSISPTNGYYGGAYNGGYMTNPCNCAYNQNYGGMYQNNYGYSNSGSNLNWTH